MLGGVDCAQAVFLPELFHDLLQLVNGDIIFGEEQPESEIFEAFSETCDVSRSYVFCHFCFLRCFFFASMVLHLVVPIGGKHRSEVRKRNLCT